MPRSLIFRLRSLLLLGAAIVIAGPIWTSGARAVSPDVVISQVYGGGGNSGATYRNDFIELFNRGAAPVSLAGWSVQYASSTGTTWQKTDLSGTIGPGQYVLVQEAQGSGGTTPLPTPDVVGTIPMSASAGKMALVNVATLIASGIGCPGAAQGVVDFVGFGGANCSETSPTPALSNTTAAQRLNSGCTDSDNNQSDFVGAAPNPRNSAAPTAICGEQAPSVTSSSPASGATNVSLASSIAINFSERVNVVAGAIQVECPAGTQVAANDALADVLSATIVPPSGLPAATTCQITVAASGVGDVDTNDPPDTLATDFAASFMTSGTVPCAAPDTPIGQIQGSGTSAALTGTRTIQGVVVADYEYPGNGTNTDSLRGFYVQNAPGSDDGDPNTSDGIFVFNGNNNSVSVGQLVQVSGTVSEFDYRNDRSTPTENTLTELGSPTIEVCGSGVSITPLDVNLPFATASALERYEGMLVRFPQTLYVSEHFQLGRFGQVLLSSGGRLQQPTNVVAPGPSALSMAAANALNQIMLDDELQVQNPDPIKFGRGGAALSASNTLRGGDTVIGLVGVLTQTDATTATNVNDSTDPVRYRLRPFNVLNPVAPDFQAGNVRPGETASVAGTLKVASLNLLNYFNTLGTAGQMNCNNGVGGTAADCRGAENATEFDRQWPKTIAAAKGIGADILVVNELENDGYGPSSSIQDLVNKLNAAGPDSYAFIDADARTGQTNALGVDAIRVAILYQPAKVTPVGQTAAANGQTAATSAFGIFQTTGGSIQRSRPALAQAFETPSGARLIVVANHLKSKGSSCADNVSPVGPDPDANDGQGECNLTRAAAAAQLVSWLQSDPTGTGSSNILLMGDFNAYQKEDPIAALESGGYTDLAVARLGAQAYSYVFDGQWGSLDHALASAALFPRVVDVIDWHINADEPSVLDYNTNFKSSAQLTGLYAADRFRASDHDALVVGLDLTAPRSTPALPPWAAAGVGLLLLGAAARYRGRSVARPGRGAGT